MNLKDRLTDYSMRSGKKSYEELIRLLEEEAKEGAMSYYIDTDEVYYDDIIRLKNEEGLEIEKLEGEGYSYGGCWKISW